MKDDPYAVLISVEIWMSKPFDVIGVLDMEFIVPVVTYA